MTPKLSPRTARALLAAGLLVGVAAAQAATGYTVTHDQESLVRPGMTEAAVEAALGHPAQNVQYRNESGPTFVYSLVGAPDTEFDVAFGADGTVASVVEHVDIYGTGAGASD